MHAAHDLADLGGLAQLLIRRAQGVIEHDDALGAALGFHQRFHLRVIDPADLALVVEIADLGVVMDKAKAVALEREAVGIGPAVAQHDAMRVGFAAAGSQIGGAGRADQRDGLAPVSTK